MEQNADVVIIGSGAAGLYCALNLKRDLRVIVVSKGKVTDTNTYLAQGGISTAKNEKDIPLFIEDTLRAGRYKNRRESVQVLAEQSMNTILDIVRLGVDLDKEDGKLSFTREGAHSINRIVHSKDKTGKALADTLIEEVKKRKNIILYENTYMTDILKVGNTCTGVVCIKGEEEFLLHAKMVVLATGGIGGIFHCSTNQRLLTGDSIAIALKNNIKLKDLEYVQFHPTAFYDAQDENRKFLISEAVRGEGGKLYNSKRERFVDELLPRDVVTEAIHKEMKKSGVPYVFLDISFLEGQYLQKRFPSIYSECLKRGIDITKEAIPVAPAQHYFMGGIEVDLKSKTSMENLYAVGETSCTGVHGANRLASNSLLEGLVFSKKAAESINERIDTTEFVSIPQLTVPIDIESLKRQNRKLVIEAFSRLEGLKSPNFYKWALLEC